MPQHAAATLSQSGTTLCQAFDHSFLTDHCARRRCPPGHGDIYPALVGSGVLDKLRGAGIKYVFVSNSDNLGATLDLKLLQHFASTEAPFIMEVAQRTASDKKGGHLCRRKSDGAHLKTLAYLQPYDCLLATAASRLCSSCVSILLRVLQAGQ